MEGWPEWQSSTIEGVATRQMFNLRHRQYIRILMIEEESLVRAALVALVTSWKGFHVIAEAATKVQALEQFRRVAPANAIRFSARFRAAVL
jgi:hypothetical protein